MNVIELNGVIKSYGPVRALDGFDLAVPQGSIFGLMGPNGAGKTTSIKLVLGLMKPDAGTVMALGMTPGPAAVELRRRMGFVPEDFSLYPYMTGDEVLRLNAALYGCSLGPRIDRLQSVFDLPLTRRISTYSKGMRKLLALYLALSTEPELLILDEPTEGLDPIVRSRFLGVLADQTAGRRLTVFFSSHILSEVE
jgi:ABC-2 type transport system ATP-binding protein